MTTIKHVNHPAQLEALVDLLSASDFIYYDLETLNDGPADDASEDWWPHSRITTASFTVRAGQSFVVPLSHPEGVWADHEHGGMRRDGGWVDVITQLAEAMQGTRLGGHNVKFDVRWIHTITGVDLIHDITWDTMVSAYVLDENAPKGLEDVAKVELGVADWKHTKIDSRRTESYPWELVSEYASKDTDYGFQIVDVHRERLREEPGLARVYGLLMLPASAAVTRVERTGLYVDEPLVQQRLAEAEQAIEETEDELLSKYVSDELKDEFCWRHYKSKPPVPVRPSWSPNSRFFHAFMEDVGAPVIERTAKKGTPSYSEAVMKRISSTGEYPYIDAMLVARKLGKDVGYLNSWLAKKDAEGYLHPTLKPAHVTTGRLSSENPNAQQVSRHLKDCFPGPPGWWFVQADYAQVELRIAAQIAHEENMLQAFRDGKDLHRIMAATMAGIEPHQVTKDQRQAAKAVNFGFLYGMGAKKFVDYAFDEYGVIFTVAEASRIRGLFFRTWPRLKEWHEEQRMMAHTQGYVRSPIGRRRRLPDLRSPMQGIVAAAERQAVNAPVQSYASDLMLLSLIELDRNPSEHRRTCGTVHDSGLHYVREGHVKDEIEAIANAMLYPPVERLFGAKLTVRLEVEFLIGRSWGDENPHVVTISTAA